MQRGRHLYIQLPHSGICGNIPQNKRVNNPFMCFYEYKWNPVNRTVHAHVKQNWNVLDWWIAGRGRVNYPDQLLNKKGKHSIKRD